MKDYKHWYDKVFDEMFFSADPVEEPLLSFVRLCYLYGLTPTIHNNFYKIIIVVIKLPHISFDF